MPVRFLCADGTLNGNNISWAFGFGRRIWCVEAVTYYSDNHVPDVGTHSPGRHVADASLWSAMVCILTLFKIEKTAGSENVEWTNGVTTCVTYVSAWSACWLTSVPLVFLDIRARSHVRSFRERKGWMRRSWNH